MNYFSVDYNSTPNFQNDVKLANLQELVSVFDPSVSKNVFSGSIEFIGLGHDNIYYFIAPTIPQLNQLIGGFDKFPLVDGLYANPHYNDHGE